MWKCFNNKTFGMFQGFSNFQRFTRYVISEFNQIKEELKKMTAIQDAVDGLTAEISKVEADFVATATLIGQEVADLKDIKDQLAVALAASNVDPAVIQGLTDRLTTSTNNIEAVLAANAPAPAPVATTVTPVVDTPVVDAPAA